MFALQDEALRQALLASAAKIQIHPHMTATRRHVHDAEYVIDSAMRSFRTRVSVDNKDAIDVALELLELHELHELHAGCKPMVLILADAHSPGGCVLGGGNMQEESLFRRTTLFASLTPNLYPIGPDEALYAGNVDVLFDGDYAPLVHVHGHAHDHALGTTLSFLACPGIKMPPIDCNGRLYPKDAALLKRKVELIMQVHISDQRRSYALGPWGARVRSMGVPRKARRRGVWGCCTRVRWCV
jgi:hypothetical protein